MLRMEFIRNGREQNLIRILLLIYTNLLASLLRYYQRKSKERETAFYPIGNLILKVDISLSPLYPVDRY